MKIDKGVPLPVHLAERVEVGDLPLKKMKVGDSIRVDAQSQKELERKLLSCRMRTSRFAKKHRHYKFKVARGTDDSGPHLRIWRVSRAN